MERVRAMIAPPSYLYEVSSARAPEGFHSVKRSRKGRIFRWISLSKIRQVIKNRLLDLLRSKKVSFSPTSMIRESQ